jgi:biogenesis AIM24-like protein
MSSERWLPLSLKYSLFGEKSGASRSKILDEEPSARIGAHASESFRDRITLPSSSSALKTPSGNGVDRTSSICKDRTNERDRLQDLRRRRSRSARRIGKSSPSILPSSRASSSRRKTRFAAAKDVSTGIAFQRKLGVGLFGGEGFIMQRLQGRGGWVVVHAGRTLHERTLAEGEMIRVVSGCIVALRPTVSSTRRDHANHEG